MNGARILYMEDNEGLARLLQRAFSRLDCTVEVAPDGDIGLEMVDRGEYDILLVDYDMPGRGGMQVLEELWRRGSEIPVIMVTGNGSERVAVEALKAGAADYVVKDVEMGYLELLPIVMNQVLSRQALQREKQQMMAVIRDREDRYRRLVELSLDGIALLSEGKFIFVNAAGTDLLGRDSVEEYLLADMLHPDHRPVFETQLRFVEEMGESTPWMEEILLRPDGSEVWVEVAAAPFSTEGPPIVQVIFRDITERVQARQRLEQLAHYDALTGVPNRALFFDRLQVALADAQRYDRRMALLFLDLDGFKEVNDTLGHEAGDQVLVETARRIQNAVRGSDTVARLGGDEFTVILGNIDSDHDVARVAERLLADLALPHSTVAGSCRVGVSIGVSIFPDDGVGIDALMKKADLAMYGVKHRGKHGYMMYMEPEVRAVA